MGRQPAFWLAVAGVAVLSQPLFNLVADSKLGAAFPALRDLNSYSTRRNG
jgi:ABC-type branched-subunit amino acid transport system permease subunit